MVFNTPKGAARGSIKNHNTPNSRGIKAQGFKGIRRNPHQRLRENMLCEATKLSPLCFLQLFTVSLVVVSEFSLTQAFRCIWTMSPHFTRS